jgi:murein DD-endopeptidase MepM/ murein hydrolase activator NlpD
MTVNEHRTDGLLRHATLRRVGAATAFVLVLSVPYLVPSPARADKLSDLKSQLASLRTEVQQSADAWDAAQTRLESTQSRIRTTDARIKVEAKNLANAEAVLGNRAAAMYRGGGQTEMVEFVLGAASWEDFVSRLDYVTLIAGADANLIRSVKNTRARLDRNKRDYQKALLVQAQDAATAKKKTVAMDAAFAAKKSQYDLILADIAAEMARTHPGGSSYPPGPNGMVFPVQGPHAYSDTWGAARSGGRAHKGTDIMASRGTPCVSTCNGVVRVHDNGLGGKSITLTGDNGWQFYYAHLDQYKVSDGARVKAGQLIGTVGNTGNAAGGACHLHFQMGPHGNWVDPYPYLRGMQ